MAPKRKSLGLTPAGIVAIAIAMLALLPSTAGAGTYAVHACKAPGGGAAGVDWERITRHSSSSRYLTNDRCPNGSFAFGFKAATAHTANDQIVYRFDAPANTALHAYSIWRSVQLGPSYNMYFSERDASGDLIGDYIETCVDACTSRGNPFNPFGPANLVRRSGLNGVDRVQITLTCGLSDSSSSLCSANSPPAASYQLHRADVRVRDDHLPELDEPPEGPLLEEGGAMIGPQQVWISASDVGSGVSEVLFVVDGEIADRATIDDNEGRCVRPFSDPRPCPLEVEGPVSFDTTRVPDGRHRLQLLVTDATGTNAVPRGDFEIETANGCNPEPRIAERRVGVRFAGKGKRKPARTIRYGNRPRVKGRLTSANGDALAGAEVCVAARNSTKRSSLRQLRTTTTNAKGRFSFRLSKGPSRKVYAVSRTSRGAAAASVRVRVRAAARLQASQKQLRNGDRVVLRGKLRGKPVPRRGVLVELQARRGSHWQTFGTKRSSRKGKFRFPYRFTRTSGVQRYSLRARVPAQGNYPYAPGASRPVRVTVVG